MKAISAVLVAGAIALAALPARAGDPNAGAPNAGSSSNLDPRTGELRLTPPENSAAGQSSLGRAFLGEDGRMNLGGTAPSALSVTPRASLLGLGEAGKGLTYFTPRGNGARIGVASVLTEASHGGDRTMFDTLPSQSNAVSVFSYSQTSFDRIEWALALGMTQAESRDRSAFGLSQGVAVGGLLRYGGLSLGAGRMRAFETGLGEELFRRSLTSGYDVGMSYAFDAGAVSVARLHGGADWLNLGRNDRDTLRLSGRYLFGDKFDVRGALAYSDALNADPTRHFDPADWALVTGFGLSF